MQIPKELSGKARIAWKRFSKQLELIQPKDRAALIVLCQSYAEMQAANEHIEVEGAVITYANGMVGLNPYCKVRDNARKCVAALLREFHLTPAAREKLKPKTDDSDGTEITF